MKNTKLKRYRKSVYSLRLSPEIECEFPEKVDIEVLYGRYRKLLNSWTVVHDGSLENGLEFKPKNSNHLHYTKECFAEISEVLHIIRKHKGKIGKTCGAHIHIDAKFTDEEIVKIVKELVARQKYIAQDFKIDKERLNNTCQSIGKNDIRGLTTEIIGKFRSRKCEFPNIPILQDKYYILNLLNLSELNTLEFRLFNGTLSTRELKRNIKFLFEFIINALERE